MSGFAFCKTSAAIRAAAGWANISRCLAAAGVSPDLVRFLLYSMWTWLLMWSMQ